MPLSLLILGSRSRQRDADGAKAGRGEGAVKGEGWTGAHGRTSGVVFDVSFAPVLIGVDHLDAEQVALSLIDVIDTDGVGRRK